MYKSRMLWTLLMIGLGGALGTLGRYGVGVGLTELMGSAWPYGTFAANVLGSFLLGLVVGLAGERRIFGANAKLVLGTGMMGGFTTYSSFNLESVRLAEQGAYLRAGGYVGATVVTCFFAGLGGLALARWIKGH